MRRIFTAAIAVAAIALAGVAPTRATTFPTLTTIYFAAGAVDSDIDNNEGVATVISCLNQSGQTASVRYQFRSLDGTLLAGGTLLVGHLATKNVSTQGSVSYFTSIPLPTSVFFGGSIQVLSTQSAVYCTAMLLDASQASYVSGGPGGVALHMVRLNPHPGTVE